MTISRILVVRLGAMGDIIHSLPAVVTLKRNFPNARITWMVDPKWTALLEGNPDLEEIIAFDPRQWRGIGPLLQRVRASHFDLAVDLQALMKSAAIVALSGARRRVGFDWHTAREPLASLAYTDRAHSAPPHAVERSLELAKKAGAARVYREFPLPPGEPEGDLPDQPFILSSPLAGWTSKQWPLEYYAQTAALLRKEGYALVVNGPPGAAPTLAGIEGARVHGSGIPGLIHAARRAAGVIGLDSGPLHLAAALGRPGVAIFGPTDPALNGPYGGTMTVLRDQGAVTTYKRGRTVAASMRAIRPEAVVAALRIRLAFHAERNRA